METGVPLEDVPPTSTPGGEVVRLGDGTAAKEPMRSYTPSFPAPSPAAATAAPTAAPSEPVSSEALPRREEPAAREEPAPSPTPSPSPPL